MTTETSADQQVRVALRDWRDSLVNLTGRNRLLNYRPTKASTLTFAKDSPNEILTKIASRKLAYVVGTRPDPEGALTENSGELEDAVLRTSAEFDYSKYPSSLFVDSEQKLTDRALRNINAGATRAMVDRGVHTSYVTFGALRWSEAQGDPRVSPLILVPIVLERLGVKQPLHVSLADEDVVVNPALSLKMSEFAIELPDNEQIVELVSDGQIEDALSLFEDVKWENGWSLEDLSVASNFMFANEAMYRDLLINEDRVAAKPLVRALANSRGTNDFTFEIASSDVIDESLPPEVVPLVLDADSSQRAAIHAALEGRSFVLDGPPGTGKSQTIANMIGALISEGKRVLFVSEKAVALDVVKQRLEHRGLSSALFELHSHNATRAAVARELGESLTFVPHAPAGMGPSEIVRVRDARLELSGYAAAVNEVRLPIGKSVHTLLGEVERDNGGLVPPTVDTRIEDVDPRWMLELEQGLATLTVSWEAHLAGPDALWFGVSSATGLEFMLQELTISAEKIEHATSKAIPDARAVGIVGAKSLREAIPLLSAWSIRRESVFAPWLVSADAQEIIQQFLGLCHNARENLDEQTRLRVVLGESPGAVPSPHPLLTEPVLDTSLLVSQDLSALDSQGLKALTADLEHANQSAKSLVMRARDLCSRIGVEVPGTLHSTALTIAAVGELLSAPAPEREWVINDEGRKDALKASVRLSKDWETLNLARKNAAPHFNEACLELDLQRIASVVNSATSLWDRLSSSYRSAKRDLRGVTKDELKLALEHVDHAVRWQLASVEVEKSERKRAASLGRQYQGADTNWDEIQRSLQAVNGLLDTVMGADTSKLYSVLKAVPLREQLHAEAESLAQDLNIFLGFVPEGPIAFEVGMVAGDPERLGELTGDALAGVEQWLTWLLNVDKVVPKPLTVAQALDAMVKREAADVAGRALVATANELRERHGSPGDLEFSFSRTQEIVELEHHLVATQEVLDAWGQLGGSGETKGGVPPVVAGGLATTRGLDPVLTALEDWESAFERLVAHFGDERQSGLQAECASFSGAGRLVRELKADTEGARRHLALREALDDLSKRGLDQAIDFATGRRLRSSDAVRLIRNAVRVRIIEHWLGEDARLERATLIDRDALVKEFRELDSGLADHAVSEIISRLRARRPTSSVGGTALIRREAEKKRKHIPVRELLSQAGEVVQRLHPCFMMSPLAVSQYLPPDIEFDVVIFDEASQVAPGDAINCVYRANALVAAGDQRQLPPTSFFGGQVDSEDDEENLAEDFDSVLDLMKGSGRFESLTLNWHYRSRHEDLIAFSNSSFYNNRLVTYPGAIAVDKGLGVRLIKVDGEYRRSGVRDNPREAAAVAEAVVRHLHDEPDLTVGVVTFSTAQRDAVENALELIRRERPELEAHFTADRSRSVFVKNLESVQGDERDKILFSIGYGPDEHGKVTAQFGPINQKGGERRLNVAVTRAKRLVEVYASMTAADIPDAQSVGVRHLRRYLDFAERGPSALAFDVGQGEGDAESPFEESVIDEIRAWGYEVQPQVGVSGYRIDIGVRHPNYPGGFVLGVECDGAMYHSSRAARDRDRLRHEILEDLGWRIHHIWGPSWYRNRAREVGKLRELLDQLSAQPLTGLVANSQSRDKVRVEIESEAAEFTMDESWVEDYVPARVTAFPLWLDISDVSNAYELADAVDEIVVAEQPVHLELVEQRIKEMAGVARIGHRIRNTIEHAILLSNTVQEGEFLVADPVPPIKVRRPANGVTRTVEQVAESELERAVTGVSERAHTATRDEISAMVAQLLGWHRRSSAISGAISRAIDSCVANGRLTQRGGVIVATVGQNGERDSAPDPSGAGDK